MIKDKTTAVVMTALVFYVIGALCGFFLGKGMYQSTEGVKVARDTLIVHDTVSDINPTPKDSATIKYITRYLPIAKRDTSSRVDHFIEVTNMVHDTVEVQVPITSKHYGSKDYDAWVSGYEPSLDSIKVYKETQYITETIEITKKQRAKKWGIGFHVGYGYDFTSKTAAPMVGVGLSYDIISF